MLLSGVAVAKRFGKRSMLVRVCFLRLLRALSSTHEPMGAGSCGAHKVSSTVMNAAFVLCVCELLSCTYFLSLEEITTSHNWPGKAL